MKILATDYDGTLRIGDDVSEENKQAIKTWRAANHLFGIVTGRSMESIKADIERNELCVDFVIGNNGGAVYDANFKEIKTWYMEFQRTMEMIEYIKHEPCISYILNDGFYRSKIVVDAQKEDKKYAHTVMEKSAEEMLANGKIAQIVVSLDNDEEGLRIGEHINQKFNDIAVAYRNINCVDIAPKGVSKASGLAYMVEKLHVKVEDVYTIGDSYNDISMIEEFNGYAMAQAPQEVQENALKRFDDVAKCIAYLMK